MDYINPLEIAEGLIKIWKHIPQRFEELSKMISQQDLKQQDILHTIENESFNACEGFHYAKMLKEVRQERRRYKDEFEMLRALKAFTDSNKNLELSLYKVKTQLENIDRRQQNPTYNQRIIGGE